MHGVGFKVLPVFAAQGAGLGLGRIRGAHQRPVAGHRVLAAQGRADHRSGRHIVRKAVKKGALFVHGIKALGLGLAQPQHFQSHGAKALSLHGGQNFPGKAARHGVRLDDGKSGLQHVRSLEFNT